MKAMIKRDGTAARVLALVAAAGVALALSACNTVSGVGQDLQDASSSVKDAMSD